MTNIKDFKVGDKVRCVVDNGIRDLTVRKEYRVLRVYGDDVELIDDAGDEYQYDIRLFEPVAKDNEDLTTLLPNMQAMGNKEIEMTNLDNFLNCKKVRCVVDNWLAYLTTEKEYEVLHVAKYTVSIIDDSGDERVYDIGLFEPVLETVTKDSEDLNTLFTNMQATENKRAKTTNVSTFKVGDKVRCVNNWHSDLTVGKEYEVLRVDKYTVHIIDERGIECNYDIGLFEPVSETATQSNDEIDSTPCETRTVAKFEVGDKVYSNLSGRIETIEEIKDKALYSISGRYMVASASCQATQENYEMLCKIYPHIEFEKPPVALKGSNLCRAMLDKGWKYVPCYVSDVSEKDAEECQCDEIVISFRDDEFIANDYWQYAVPFDLRTGEPLTEEVLK